MTGLQIATFASPRMRQEGTAGGRGGGTRRGSGRILIAEDAPRIAAFLERGLRSNGYTTAVAKDGTEALRLASSDEFDLMILDLGLPDFDGFDVLRRLREQNRQLPVIIVTARDSVSDKVAGLEGGADDYLRKPFNFEELLARVRARLRGERAREASELVVDDVLLDLRTRALTVRGVTTELSAREFALAEMFFRHPGQVLSREQILRHVWGDEHDHGTNVLAVYVGYLRKRLGRERIANVRGIGYRLEKRSRASSGGRILLIEDEPRISDFMSRALSADGYEVVTAQDGELGTFLAVTDDVDLVVLDLGLPAMQGIEVLDEIRRARPRLPVLVVTGRDEPDVRARCLEYGNTDFLVKPLAVDALRAVVRSRLVRP